MYCKNCGKQIDDKSLFCPFCGEKQELVDNTTIRDVEATTSMENPSPTQSPRKPSTIVADEIIANLKMIGLALLASAIFIGIFWLCHIKDRKPVSENYFGYSCYDPPSMDAGGSTDWKEVYRELKHKRFEQEDKELENEAKRIAERNREYFFDKIDNTRKYRSEEDLKVYSKYGLLISLSVTVLGRYLIKTIKWVAKNKSK